MRNMYSLFLLAFISFHSLQLSAQWDFTSNPGVGFTNAGKIGITTSTPGAQLSLGEGTHLGGKRLLIYENSSNVQSGLGIDMSGTSRELTLFHSSSDGVNGDISFGKYLESNSTYTENMRITGAGNVGIGTGDTKGYKLAVNGNAVFTKVVVKAYSNWPDYVFHANYRLRPLSEVAQYINQYHHLPEVVAAEDVEKNGLDVSDNQAALLKKIEELTLYVIEQDKQIKQLEILKKEVEELKAAIREIRK